MSLLQHKNFILSIGILLLSCKETNESQQLIPEPTAVKKEISTSPLSYDQILGALVGSAIGDAMGASTEMWNREDIYKTYGYISGTLAYGRHGQIDTSVLSSDAFTGDLYTVVLDETGTIFGASVDGLYYTVRK